LATRIAAQANEKATLQVDSHRLTSVSGLYAAGDVVSARDQIAVAMGYGPWAMGHHSHRDPQQPLVPTNVGTDG